MENLVLSMSRQLAPAIKVNAIAPALLMFNDGDDAQYRQKALKKSLMQCEPGSQEVVNTINYLLASQYITGRVLALDGGRHLNFP
jgi:dihydromonapterin reductase/dihydrofolate reductase